ncbi:MAG: metallophosphoesterase [Acidobacteriota bacterium]|nr:metallophosphoesterase [Acidobacteriota bacterium]
MFRYRFFLAAAVFPVLLWLRAGAADSGAFRFVILGDRTGEAQPGVYEQIWTELAAQKPAFVLSVGDTIQGADDRTAESQWEQVEQTLSAWKRFPLYLTPGNHDIWSARSAQLFERYAGHPPHYSFDYGPAHFTILNNSQSDNLPAGELAFLDQDLRLHSRQTVRFIVSHRPSWLVDVIVNNPNFELQRIAKRYNAAYVIAGHVHELLHAELDGVTYVSVPSAGGHLRGNGRYADGWFFGYTVVDIQGSSAAFQVREVGTPHGEGRTTPLSVWGKAGLRQSP